MTRRTSLSIALGVALLVSSFGFCDDLELRFERAITIRNTETYVMPVLYGEWLITANEGEISLLSIMGNLGKKQLVALNKGLTVVWMDRFKEQLLYIYGDNNFGAELAIYELSTGQNRVLSDLEPNQRSTLMHPFLKGAYWIDQASFIYQVFDNASKQDQIKRYDLQLKTSTLLKVGRDLSIADFNRNVRKIMVSEEESFGKTRDYIYDTEFQIMTPFGIHFSSVAILNSQILIGCGSSYLNDSYDHPYIVGFSNDFAPKPVENVIGARDIRYSPDEKRLLILTRWPPKSPLRSISLFSVIDGNKP